MASILGWYTTILFFNISAVYKITVSIPNWDTISKKREEHYFIEDKHAVIFLKKKKVNNNTNYTLFTWRIHEKLIIIYIVQKKSEQRLLVLTFNGPSKVSLPSIEVFAEERSIFFALADSLCKDCNVTLHHFNWTPMLQVDSVWKERVWFFLIVTRTSRHMKKKIKGITNRISLASTLILDTWLRF